jgi:hypothetical protein
VDAAIQARLIDDLRDHRQLVDLMEPIAQDFRRTARLAGELAPADARHVLTVRRAAYVRALEQTLRAAAWLTELAS